VDEILVEGGWATGVRLANGDTIRSKKGVVSDVGMWSTLSKLVPKDVLNGPLAALRCTSKIRAAVTAIRLPS
jgi:hypothetical protein